MIARGVMRKRRRAFPSRGRRLPPFSISFTAGAALLLALMYFLDNEGILAAMLPAVLIHEMGHMTALIAIGCPPRALNATLSGFSLDYWGEPSPTGQALSALAGPGAGLLFAWLCAYLGNRFESEYLLLSSGAGLVINLFNLLPAYPLDGGRALNALLSRFLAPAAARGIMAALGLIVSMALITAGVFFFTQGLGFALIPAGLWLLTLQIRAKISRGLVKIKSSV